MSLSAREVFDRLITGISESRWQDLAENWGREMRFRGQSLRENSLKQHGG